MLNFFYLGAFFADGLDTIFSTQGIMVMLLTAYGGAMWVFLTSAPKVHTVMVSDLEIAQEFYEVVLGLPVADLPLHYYYNYEQSLGTPGIDPLYLSMNSAGTSPGRVAGAEGLWYQLKKNTQIHVLPGASLGEKNNQRHVCFDQECLDLILLKVQSRRLKHKIRRQKPLNFLVKNYQDQIIELAEISD